MEERGRAYSFRAQSRVHFGKVVFRNTMAGGTSWPWKINGPIYEPPSKRTVNKISAMSIHFPRTFNHPPKYKEVITRDGCWEDWFRSSVLSLLILFSLLYRLHSKYQLYWHSYINFDRKVFIGEMFEYEFVSRERALFTLPVYYIKVYFKNSHKNIYSVRFIGAVLRSIFSKFKFIACVLSYNGFIYNKHSNIFCKPPLMMEEIFFEEWEIII